ncbi:MAG: ABC transporter family protein [Micavibrio sp.]|nr:ABC transporter family protein [Micavibrio sp.]
MKVPFIPHKEKYKLDYRAEKTLPQGLFSYIKMVMSRDPAMWAYLVVTDILHAVRYPIAFVIMGMVIDSLSAASDIGTIPSGIWGLVAVLFAVLLIGELCHLIPHYTSFDWIKRVRPQLRSDMMLYAMDHPFTYFQDHFAGSLARRISEGVEKIPDLNSQIRWEILLNLVGMVVSGLVLLGVSWIYSLIIMIFLISIALPILFYLRKMKDKTEVFSSARSAVSGQIVDTLSNISVVKSFANEGYEMRAHEEVSEREMKAWHKMLRVYLMLDNWRRIALVLFGVAMMAACLLGWQYGLITIGEIATIMGLAFSFTSYAWAISFGIIHTSQSFGYLSDTLKTIAVPIDLKDHTTSEKLNVTSGEINISNLTFKYTDKDVLENLSLHIKSGERIGLVGISGAGKSTLINLIQRMFLVPDGSIFIDGQDINAVTQKSLRRSIALIPQDTSMFHRTIRENIRYGNLRATDEEVVRAAELANAHEFIISLPQGYDTKVGERGVKLSGGQRQRIAIARALLKDAPILILDEATSALDTHSERLIQKSLENLMKGKTVIAIAHRLSTIANLDRIVVMAHGRIAEEGTHQELLERKGLYAELWAMQTDGFLPE